MSKKILCKFNWYDFDNSEGFHDYKANFVRDTLHSDHNDNLNEKGSEESILFSGYNDNNDNISILDNLTGIKSFNPSKVLNDICQNNSNRFVIVQNAYLCSKR